MHCRRFVVVVLAAWVAGALTLPAAFAETPLTTSPLTASPLTASPLAVHAAGNQLVDGAGSLIELAGVNRSGTEYACAQGYGIFDGPSTNASIAAMTTWAAQIVRVPLNEDCWLGINGVNPAYGGAAYRSAIHGYVRRLELHGLLVDLELHWNAPGSQLALGQQVMADADHSVTFWRSVARNFGTDSAVLFELYNEPHDISWDCWLSGCTTTAGWKTAGMQQMLDAVRATGATNVVLAGGLGYSSDLTQWLTYRPVDPSGQLAAAFHTYNFSGCNAVSCWDSTVAPVAAQVPVVASEFGENDCAGGYVGPFMDWADGHGLSYLAWTWDTWDCGGGPALITSYDGTPSGFGLPVRTHFLARG